MRRTLAAALSVGLVLLGGAAVTAPSASAATQAGGTLVSEVPRKGTPHVLDGRVLSIVEVGNQIVLGGTFTRARNNDDTTELSRTGLLAFDKSTGRISTTFVPQTNGYVNAVVPAADGQSVYVGGVFTTIGGVARKNIARVRLSDGAVLTGFNAGTVGGEVRDLRLRSGKLWVAGSFTNIAGRTQPGLATLYPASGAFHPYMRLAVAGVHNGGTTTVTKIDINPAGDRLIAIGNFRTLAGVTNRQFFSLDLSGTAAAASTLRTTFYEASCASAFDTYTRDLDFSPDGSFFVISTTGAYGGSTGPCDTTARFETYASGAAVQPSWVNYTGGDTTYAVEISDAVVYTGGHARWQNNAFAADTAGPGAVSREGIAALDPTNGLPLTWNPTRERGVGVFDLLLTADGLWVGSDTTRIGADYLRSRIALLPAANGEVVPPVATPTLPNDVYSAYPLGAQPDPTPVVRVNAAGSQVNDAPIVWASDTSLSPSSYHNSLLSRNSYSGTVAFDSTVPAGTPTTIFNSELAGNSFANNQSWNIPMQAGAEVELRLYFANRSSSTSSVGQRRFHVDVEGTRALNNFDVVAAAGGTNRATMRSFSFVSDGNIDLDLSRIGGASYPMISAVEVRRVEASPAPASPLVKRAFSGGSFGADVPVGAEGVDWNAVRGAFMINGDLYLANADGTFVRRSFDGTALGAPEAVNTQDLLTPLTDWANDIKSATSMFYDNGRIYFTLQGQSSLYYRYFTAQSKVVGAKRLVAGTVPGLDLAQVRGAFATEGKVWFATRDGKLTRFDWATGSDAGIATGGTQVSGPGIDGLLWNSRALFAFQAGDGSPAALPPVAAFTASCTSLACSFDASQTQVPGGLATAYSWTFGDGAEDSGAQATHTYPAGGTYLVTLTASNAGGTSTTTQEVTIAQVNQAPVARFTATCAATVCSFDASASSDVDGDPLTYAWDFGDGTTDTGVTASHAYDGAGTRTVTLTVSDGTLEGSTTREVSVVLAAVEHVAAAQSNQSATNHRVTVPAQVRAGDTLVLFMSTNSSTVALNDTIPGWTLLESRDGNGIRGRAWTRTAEAGDAGSVVTVTTASSVKSAMTLSAYRNPAGASATVASAVTGSDAAATSVTTPTATVPDAQGWVVSYWSSKSAEVPTWSLPGGVASRTQSTGSGSGQMNAVLADSAAATGTGTQGGLVAGTGISVARSISFTVVVTTQ